jgi:hypothetical protein
LTRDEPRVGFDFDPVVEGGEGRVFAYGTTVDAELVRVGYVGYGLDGGDGFRNVFFGIVVVPFRGSSSVAVVVVVLIDTVQEWDFVLGDLDFEGLARVFFHFGNEFITKQRVRVYTHAKGGGEDSAEVGHETLSLFFLFFGGGAWDETDTSTLFPFEIVQALESVINLHADIFRHIKVIDTFLLPLIGTIAFLVLRSLFGLFLSFAFTTPSPHCCFT